MLRYIKTGACPSGQSEIPTSQVLLDRIAK